MPPSHFFDRDGMFKRYAIFLVFAQLCCGYSALATEQPVPDGLPGGLGYLDSIRVPTSGSHISAGDPLVIAVVDDGIRTTHSALKDFIWLNAAEIPGNGIDDDGNGFIDDAHGWDVSDNDATVAAPEHRQDLYHGTHLAGIVSRIMTRALGDHAPDLVRIMPVKSLPDDAPVPYIVDGYKGIDYAVHNGADIIIAAWGVGHISAEDAAILKQAAASGVLIVAAAGNLPEERDQFPAASPYVLAVGSVDSSGTHTTQSNYGQFVDMLAPGVDILGPSALDDSGYETRTGSSFSTAMVASAAALVKLRHRTFTWKKVEACLKSTSRPVEGLSRELGGKLGSGILDVAAALDCPLITRDPSHTAALVHTKGFLYASPGHEPRRWTLSPPGEFKGIRFTPIRGSNSARSGTLEIQAKAGKAEGRVWRYDLNALPDTIFVPAQSISVSLLPGDGATGDEWLLEYAAETIDFRGMYCSGVRHISAETILTDGSGADPYSAQSSCKWQVVAPAGKRVRFNFDQLDTEPHRDLIYFFNGSGTHEKIMAIFSGTELPPEFTTWTNEVLVWFVTDGQNQGQGWSTKVSFVEDPPR